MPVAEISLPERALADETEFAEEFERRGVVFKYPCFQTTQPQVAGRPGDGPFSSYSAIPVTTIFGAPDADADLRVEIAPVDGVYGGLSHQTILGGQDEGVGGSELWTGGIGDLAMEFGAAAGSPVRRAVPGQFLPIRAGVKDSRDMVLGESLKGDGHSVLLSLTMLLDRLPCYS